MDLEDNNLSYLEAIHNFVEVRVCVNVCGVCGVCMCVCVRVCLYNEDSRFLEHLPIHHLVFIGERLFCFVFVY